jgi:hypothetical protein
MAKGVLFAEMARSFQRLMPSLNFQASTLSLVEHWKRLALVVLFH